MTLIVDFEQVDDPEMDISTSRIEDGRFLMDGWIDSGGVGVRFPQRGKHRVKLTATRVESFSFTDEAGTGTLIPETVEVEEHRVRITGVIPATLTLATEGRSDVRFEIEESPFAVRRRFKWIAV
ncbi:hypothetical protein [Agromyces sp. GXQ0307]|uniref:hypothetical protein n=1 Tax=Agromyces sp. GXQ0307 TaxID=3377835 RepID=UPI00383A140A